MTPEQIIEMAKQADIWQPLGLPSDWDRGDYVASPHQLRTFAQLVRNSALEEAAKVCDWECDNWDEDRPIRLCANLIRIRKNHDKDHS